jgi:protein adenylyltransferase
LKGSGPTPFSRQGDGRAALGPVLREYIVSEAMAALGVPTTRSLAAVTTGDMIWRDTLLPGAVLTRVASSHIRVGTFQFFAAREDINAVRRLADYAIARHYPQAKEEPNSYRALLDAVIARQAALIARWMSIGFIHGVMNTDNTSIAGETIDYGPCAFVDAYHPSTVFSSIDSFGRYAYGNQPTIAGWNLARLAETLLPLLESDDGKAIAQANQALSAYPTLFEREYLAHFRAKLGLTEMRDEDESLIRDLLDVMAANGTDFTLSFRLLGQSLISEDAATRLRRYFADTNAFEAWIMRWRQRTSYEVVAPEERCESMRKVNPLFIPRNHRIEEVIAAALKGDYAPFETLLSVLARPFDEQPGREDYDLPPQPDQVVRQTFCGT